MPLTDFNNRCCFYAVSAGTGDFVNNGAVEGHGDPNYCMARDGDWYHYYAQNSDGSQFEDGWGQWFNAIQTITRSWVSHNSDHTEDENVLIDFSEPPTVDLFPSPTDLEIGFPSGTTMLFYQATAPLGWTQQDVDDYAIRAVNNTGGEYGGYFGFSEIFSRYETDAHSIDGDELTYHAHDHSNYYPTYHSMYGGLAGGYYYILDNGSSYADAGGTTTYTGSSSGHVHGIEMRVAYIDVIVATRD